MSKHIWRGLSCGHEFGDFVLKELGGYKSNCLVIEDAACFPVKEAMRLCEAAIKYQSGISEPGDLAEMAKRYYSAVARMKAKKARKA